MAAVAGGHDAVEEVHAARDGLDNVARRADAHQVAGLVLRHMLLDGLNRVVHLLMRLSDGEAAYGVARAAQLGYALHVLDAQVAENRALVYAEEHLARVHGVRLGVILRECPYAALEPARRALAGLLHVLVGRGYLHALVECHGDVAAEVGLYAHALLRAHEDVPPVDVGVEAHAVLPYLPQLREGENLEAAAVREYGAVPGHEFVQPAEGFDEPVAGADVQVVGVRELYLAADILQVAGGERALYRALRADVHEYRRLRRAVRAGKLAAPRASLAFYDFKQGHPSKFPTAYSLICRGGLVNPKALWGRAVCMIIPSARRAGKRGYIYLRKTI